MLQRKDAHSLATIDASEWPRLAAAEHRYYFTEVPGEIVLALLKSMETIPAHGYPLNVYRHSLQSASRCLRAGEPDEMVVVALLHDIGEALTAVDHGAIAAAIVGPFVSEENAWLLEHHPVFQEYYYADKLGRDRHRRERFRGHPYFETTLRFCETFDQSSFDPSYEELPLDLFEPLVRRTFAREPHR